MGVVTGDMFVNGKALDGSFQRKTGYGKNPLQTTFCMTVADIQ